MQVKNKTETQDSSSRKYEPQVAFGSNCVRLSAYEWIFVGIVIFGLLCFGPILWERVEKFEPESNFRLPYELSNDYWLYRRYCRWAGSRHKIPLIGDSVIWGHFVSRNNTLSGHLNKIAVQEMFVNLGVDGIHPAALSGLLKYYGRDISDKKIILHFNPLWMSSGKHDLQTEKEFHFNHPRLVPQFTPRIPCYKASCSTRISAVVKRYITLPNWISHLNITYFQNMDVPTWTFENPCKNPFKAVTFRLPGIDSYEQSESTPQDTLRHMQPKNGIGGDGYQWVTPETSLQWSCFRRSIELLRERKNKVFVLVGPFNEHTLEGKSLETYQRLKSEIEQWLRQNNVAYYMPPALPAEFYRDASHPTSEGYKMLAKQLFKNESFQLSILRDMKDSSYDRE